MASLVSRALTLYRDQGPLELAKRAVQFAYGSGIRPRLPRRTVDYNGVTVRGARYFDSVVPWETLDRPSYESGIVTALESTANAGDSVVIVGGGWGVSSVAAASLVGYNGSVQTFEAATEAVERVHETLALNGVDDRVSVTNAVVAEEISTRGSTEDVPTIPPEELPECDILVLDCEGAEYSILPDLASAPRVVIVETHGFLGAPSDEVQLLLEDRGYSVVANRVADDGLRELCESNDVHVLTAQRS